MKHNLSINIIILFLIMCLMPASAMHIMEGFLPPKWAVLWGLAYLPFLIFGLWQMKKIVFEDSHRKLLLALCAAFVFVLSALKMPSVTGSCSHPTGVGLGIVLFGPWVMSVLGGIVLLFQALFLAHGGVTTLGANGFSMAVAGPMLGYAVWWCANTFKIRKDVGVFLCAFTADIVTYLVTSVQLGLAFPDPSLGVGIAILKFMGIFAVTQLPIAIAEGFLTVIIYAHITEHNLFKKRATI